MTFQKSTSSKNFNGSLFKILSKDRTQFVNPEPTALRFLWHLKKFVYLLAYLFTQHGLHDKKKLPTAPLLIIKENDSCM